MQLDRYCTVEGDFPRLDEDGFLIDRWRGPLSEGLSPGLIPLLDACTESAVLLGEAGAGKTYALQTVVDAHSARSATGPIVAHRWVDLGEVRTWEDLIRKASPALSHLLQRTPVAGVGPVPGPRPSGRVLLVLDGVDECKAKPKEITGWLTDLSEYFDCTQLQVLIGCRSMAYTDAMRRAVKKAFGISHAHVLAPLRRLDLDQAALSHGLDPERFRTAVAKAGAGSLARTPLTLSLLLNLYLAERRLPARRVELYGRALPLMVMGQGDNRNQVELAGSHEQRFMVAARLACYSLLTGASAVDTTRRPFTDDHHIAIDDLIGAVESAPQGAFTLDPLLVESVLSSPLFVSNGPGVVGVAHASIAAYLAARYLADHHLPDAQLRGLFIQRGEIGSPGIRSDLRETAAWLIALRPGLAPWLIEADTEAIASYSAYIDDSNCHHLIVERLLRLARDGDLHAEPWWNRHRYRLDHPRLTHQLRTALKSQFADQQHAAESSSRYSDEEAELALILAAQNEQSALLPEVIRLALDTRRTADIRRLAVNVASSLDPLATGPQMKPVMRELMDHPERDPNDGLRGAVLQACWPNCLTVSEMLTALTSPRRKNYSGEYTRFCSALPDQLAEDDVIPVLEWAGETLIGSSSGSVTPAWAGWARADEMTQGLLDRCLDGPAAVERIPAVARWLHRALKLYPSLSVPAPLCVPPNSPTADQARALRRLLAAELISLGQDDEDGYLLVQGWSRRSAYQLYRQRTQPGPLLDDERDHLLDGEDLSWLLDLEAGLSLEAAPRAWSVIRWIWSSQDSEAQEAAWAREGTRVWKEVFAWHLEAVPLDSPRAEAERESYLTRAARKPAPRTWDGYEEYVQSTADLLKDAEAGMTDSFWRLCTQLRFHPDTGRSGTDIGHDILALPGVRILPAGADDRLRTAAVHYLTAVEPSPEWIGTDTIYWPAWAGYLALDLHSRHPSGPTSISPQTWRRWAPLVLAFPAGLGGTDGTERQADLLRHARTHAHQELSDTYLHLIRTCLRDGSPCIEAALAQHMWTQHLEDQLSNSLAGIIRLAFQAEGHCDNDRQRNVEYSITTVLRMLLEHSEPAARTRSLKAVSEALFEGPPTPVSRLHAALMAVLLNEAPEIYWPCVAARIRADDSGLNLIIAHLFDRAGSAWLIGLPTSYLAELAGLLVAQHPFPTLPIEPTSGWVTSEERARQHRDTTLERLAARGTAEAVQLLVRLSATQPHSKALAALVRESERTHREKSWKRPTPQELAALIRDPRTRLIHDGDDLTDLVIETFAALQNDLTQGTHPAAILWNEVPGEAQGSKGARQRLRFPKDENLISDYLADLLRRKLTDQGILINREVQINRNIGGTGDRIDLLLQIPASSQPQPGLSERPNPPIDSVIIEVKGNWHPQLSTAMEHQLANDYVASVETGHGLYLTLYFPASQWTAPDKYRRRPASIRKQTVAELRRTLHDQAMRLSAIYNIRLRSFVLDLTIRETAERNN
ncbi:NACHT domain-containing protein [Streptomyces iakyrus]|uniref:NACHT domain-containing protein n=1 Tax=Streptomyces iakyrus TaxID=68219 RepID=UPI003826B400